MGERVIADRCYVCGNGYIGKAGTICERSEADRHYACRNSYTGKAGAIFERIITKRCYACGDGYLNNVSASSERTDFRYGKIVTLSIWAVVGGYIHRAFCCRACTDTVRSTVVDYRKFETVSSGKPLSLGGRGASPKCQRKHHRKKAAYVGLFFKRYIDR